MDLTLKLKLAAAAMTDRPFSIAVLAAFVVVLAAFWVLALGFFVDRTILVDTRTRMVSIAFSGESNAWPIGDATVCTPLETPNPFAARGDGPCDPRLYSEDGTSPGFVDWGPRGQAEVFIDRYDRLVISARCSSSLPEGTRIILEEDAWRLHGAFGWIGSTVIGQRAGSGETGLLIDGSFEAREVVRLPHALRTTEVVKTGQVRSGEAVRLVTRSVEEGGDPDRSAEDQAARWPASEGEATGCGPDALQREDPALPRGYRPAVAFGHIVVETHPVHALRVVALTAPGNTALLVDFAGASRPALVRPNWIDRLTSSPLVTALATALAVAVALVNFAAGLARMKETLVAAPDPETAIGEPAAASDRSAMSAHDDAEAAVDVQHEAPREAR